MDFTKEKRTRLLAALGAVGLILVLTMVGLAISGQLHTAAVVNIFRMCLAVFVLGTVTVTYAYPVSGTTPPTSAQAVNSNLLTATVNAADGDTTWTITHNWGLSAAQLANLWPLVHVYVQVSGTAGPLITAALTNSNVVTFGKSSSAGTGGTYVVELQRPHSLIT